MRYSLIIGLCLVFFVSCKTESGKTEQTQKEEIVAPPSRYTLTPFSPSQDYPDARIESIDYRNGKFNFEIGDSDYELGVQTPDAGTKMCANSDKGQHIHLILGKDPYVAKYVPEFELEVADGDHQLLAFLSRSYHESIKTADAFVGLQIKTENGDLVERTPITEPTLFYSRPKGTYIGKANTEKVMLDFYLLNADLGEDYQVRVSINGEEHQLGRWQPYYIEGLPMGENTITLTLLNKNGDPVESSINPVSRTFTLKSDPAEG